MPIELPPMRTGNIQEDFARLWDWAFKLAEALRLQEEERNGVPKT